MEIKIGDRVSFVESHFSIDPRFHGVVIAKQNDMLKVKGPEIGPPEADEMEISIKLNEVQYSPEVV